MSLDKKDFYSTAISELTNSNSIVIENLETNQFTYELEDKSKTMPSQSEIDTKAQELLDAHNLNIQNKENKKLSGKQKLKDLGLDDEEIQALMSI
jgi:hypothetical protein